VVVVTMLRILGADEALGASGDRTRTDPTLARPARRIVVSIPDRKLAVLENDSVLRLFQVAVGSPTSPSPTGTFTIVNRIDRPTYYAPGKVIPSSDRNPLGTRWLGLNVKGYGIHGTDVPSSIGHARSHGCIRLRNRDIEQLFEMVRPGDLVELHGERTPEIARIFSATERANTAPAVVAAALRPAASVR
jgi:lipoprotein-anchoring transpeptidase ErfK/SrfK